MKRRNRLAVLPKQLIESIQSLKLTATQEYNAIQLCEVIKSNQIKDKLLNVDYVDLPKNYLMEIYKDNRYYTWLNILKLREISKGLQT